MGEDTACPSRPDTSQDAGGLSPVYTGLSAKFDDVQDRLELRTRTPRPHRPGDVEGGLEPSLTYTCPGSGAARGAAVKTLRVGPPCTCKVNCMPTCSDENTGER